MYWAIAAVYCVVFSAFAPAAASEPVSIRLDSEIRAEREALARDELSMLLKQHDLERWTFTRNVIIQSGVIPHSHPVLTLNTRYLGDEIGTLSAYLHEQFHWLGVQNESAFGAAIADLRRVYPDAPSQAPKGARDKESTYLHLIVCMLEYQALTELFGEDAAHEELASKRFYTWIYKQVLENGAPIRAVMATHAISLP